MTRADGRWTSGEIGTRSDRSGRGGHSARRAAFAFVVLGPLAVVAGCGDDPRPSQPTPTPRPPQVSEAPAVPPPSAPTPAAVTHTVRAATGTFTARWSTDPDPIPLSDPFAMDVELFADEACTSPLADGTLTVDASMPHHGHGMNLKAKVESLGGGRYHVTGMLFHMPGRWELTFDRTRNGLLERAQTTVIVQPSVPATAPTSTGTPATPDAQRGGSPS